MDKKLQILKFYYEDDMKIIDIANSVKVSRAYISKVIKDDERYQVKKDRQKEETRQRKKQYTNYKMKQIREEKSKQDAFLRKQHLQASRELSGGRATISNRAFRSWNSSVYQYNKKTNAYHLKKGIITGFDVPRKIKM